MDLLTVEESREFSLRNVAEEGEEMAKSKIKARRLILEEYSSTESRAAALKGRPTQEAGPETNTEKYAGVIINGSYVEIALKRTRTDVATASAVVVKERKNQSTKAKYQVLQKSLAEEVEKWRYSEKACEGLREDVERAKCVTMNLLSRLESCLTAYNVESLRMDELTATAEKKEQEYEIELAAKAKKLAEYEAARISNLEFIEKL
ncbi:hypothetical protein AXG93_638s1340 [Marchantia polymorpha subsp. ruderalis]|uniref:Uncharacterized protein n=1 Tax=Marchantia polymorpha subsp. ruderalis TaxID=1480154 RepID=A0A176W6Y9_MARPO|nr:hypothetical protein AXG93_638s1340 [Marchantia polymorpha subsp. ruderalis]